MYCRIYALILFTAILNVAGCSTLSSLGFPVGATGNEILDPAKSISESPGESFLISKELATQPLELYVVDVGDTILIEPVKFDATIRLPGDQVVKPDGQISLGEFGRYPAVGKSLEQIQIEVQAIIDSHLQRDLEAAFEVERQPFDITKNGALELDGNVEQLPAQSEDDELRVNLQRRIRESILRNEISTRLVNWDSKKVYVLGEVNSPGSFIFSGNQTVLDAIIEAGGLTNRSNRHQIIVARPTSCDSCRIVMKICYDQIVQLGDASTNYQLMPGDRVFVPSLTFCDDLKRSLRFQKHDHCPRCSAHPQGCNLPTGCE